MHGFTIYYYIYTMALKRIIVSECSKDFIMEYCCCKRLAEESKKVRNTLLQEHFLTAIMFFFKI